MTAIAAPAGSAGQLMDLVDVIRSEWCKLRSVRSTLWTAVFAVAANIIVAALAAILLPSHLSAHDKATLDSIRVSLAGLHLSQSVVPLVPAKRRRLPAGDWLERDNLVCCPDPDERVVMRIERTGERALVTEELT